MRPKARTMGPMINTTSLPGRPPPGSSGVPRGDSLYKLINLELVNAYNQHDDISITGVITGNPRQCGGRINSVGLLKHRPSVHEPLD
ncbi:hypothetical protein J6590_026449 [Homalodisca vitripennis]|nr:hypothetical protein J6590_026449 [Homalodisca vitripennis]